jgi:hypothetical protein
MFDQEKIYLSTVPPNYSPILRILVDPGRADGLMLMPNPKKLRIGGPVVSAKFQI